MTTDNEDDSAVGHFRHQQFIDDIAERVEEKLVARFTKFLLLNAAALIGIMGTGISAYYSLDKRQTAFEAITEKRISINDARIERLINEDIGQRDTCVRIQGSVQDQLNQIRQMFYEHDRTLNQQRR